MQPLFISSLLSHRTSGLMTASSRNQGDHPRGHVMLKTMRRKMMRRMMSPCLKGKVIIDDQVLVMTAYNSYNSYLVILTCSVLVGCQFKSVLWSKFCRWKIMQGYSLALCSCCLIEILDLYCIWVPLFPLNHCLFQIILHLFHSNGNNLGLLP